MKMPAAPSLKVVRDLLGVGFVGVALLLAGVGLAPYVQPYNPWAPKPAVAVKGVATASIDPYARRTQELCASVADNVAKMRDELKELRTRAAAKIAPSK